LGISLDIVGRKELAMPANYFIQSVPSMSFCGGNGVEAIAYVPVTTTKKQQTSLYVLDTKIKSVPCITIAILCAAIRIISNPREKGIARQAKVLLPMHAVDSIVKFLKKIIGHNILQYQKLSSMSP
jgi:hypothetical protein